MEAAIRKRRQQSLKAFVVAIGLVVDVAQSCADTSGRELCSGLKQGLGDCLSEAKSSSLTPRQCPETKKAAAAAFARAMKTTALAQKPVFERVYGLWLYSAEHVDPADASADQTKLRNDMIELFRTCYGLENTNP